MKYPWPSGRLNRECKRFTLSKKKKKATVRGGGRRNSNYKRKVKYMQTIPPPHTGIRCDKGFISLSQVGSQMNDDGGGNFDEMYY